MSASELFVYSELATPRVRVGIVAEESRLPAYAGSVVRDLLRANFVEPTCWFEVPRVADAPTRSSIGTLLFRLQELLVEPKYATEPDPLALVDSQSLSSQFKHTIQLAPPGNSNVVDRGDVGSLILEYKLDVIVDFTNRGVERSFADMSSFGLWRFHFGDSRKYPFGSGYWREIVDNEALSGTELRSVGRTHEADRVLSRALFSTTPFPSRLANRLAPIWGATHFVLKNLRELQHSRRNNLRLESRSGGLGPLVRPQPRMPANKDMARWLVREVRRRSIRQFRRQATSRSSWRIALRKSAVPLFLDDHPATLDTFRWLDSKPGHSWADPTLVEKGGQVWMFFEDHDHDLGRGVIGCGLLNGDGKLEELATALARDHHLSYPQIIKQDGAIFMVPESAQSGSVDLYRARKFPYDWVFEARLVSLACVDSTVFFARDTWWMLTSPVLYKGHAPITWLLSSRSLTGPWSLTRAGAVAASASYARGAGNIVHRYGRLIRPSQDCSIAYGRALVFNEITSLDNSSYAEKPIARVEGRGIPGLFGIHTYSVAGEWEAIDGLMDSSR